MRLSGLQLKRLRNALVDAFPSTASLERILPYELNKNLRVIAGEGNSKEIVFQLIQDAMDEGWLKELVQDACNNNPGNPKLKALFQEILNLSEERLQLDFEPSSLWSFHHCSLVLKKFLNDTEREEEWIGDLKEVLYKMHEGKRPKWKLHFETLRRTFDLSISAFFVKVNLSFSKKKSTK